VEFLIFLLFVWVLFSLIGPPKDPRIKANPCPPHKWKGVEIKDGDGNTITKLICEKCGPLQR
jgi:hypothetical protein